MVYLFGTICLIICVVLVKVVDSTWQRTYEIYEITKRMLDYNMKANDNLYTALGIKPKEVEDGN